MNKALLRPAAVLLSLLMLLSLASCGDTAQQGSTDIYALTEEMRAQGDFPEMLTIKDGDSNAEKGFAAICDLDYSKAARFDLLYAADGSAYELAVIELKDPADMPLLEQSLKKHIEKRVLQYRQYDPSQVPLAESAAVTSHGAYAALIMCGDPAALKATFTCAF